MDKELLANDRRKAKRKNAKFSMRYKIVGRESREMNPAITIDISADGILFEAQEAVPVGSKIEAYLIVPVMSRPVEFSATVNRFQRIDISFSLKSRFLHAATFDQIQLNDKFALENYVQLVDLDSILRLALKRNSSDVHLVANQPPVFRVEGDLQPLDAIPFTPSDLQKMIFSIMTERQRTNFEQNLELDLSYHLPEGNRFRVNVHLEKGNIEAAFRIIPEEIKSVAELGLPPIVEELSRKKKGLIVVTGPAGSGKSTTLAAMIDLINRERKCMVISIEDPVEYVHKSKKSIIKQREVGIDTLSFANALKHTLRQDPNVILVGEMRDLESISMAITAAETGHLVLATLHTPDTIECINRIVDVYPASQQNQVPAQLAACLQGVIAQILMPLKEGEGRAVATEILVGTPAIRNLIRTKKFEQIYSYIETGSQYGMHTMDHSLIELIDKGLIDMELAMGFMKDISKYKV